MSTKFKENLALVETLSLLVEGKAEVVTTYESPDGEVFTDGELDESGKAHYPFKRYDHLGNKTPQKSDGPNSAGKWNCTSDGPYSQVCHGVSPENEGWIKRVKVDKSYKKKYNHDYKTGMASGKYEPAVRSGGTRASKKAAKKAAKNRK